MTMPVLTVVPSPSVWILFVGNVYYKYSFSLRSHAERSPDGSDRGLAQMLILSVVLVFWFDGSHLFSSYAALLASSCQIINAAAAIASRPYTPSHQVGKTVPNGHKPEKIDGISCSSSYCYPRLATSYPVLVGRCEHRGRCQISAPNILL